MSQSRMFERRSRRFPWRVGVMCAAVLAGIVFLTLCPLQMRPTSGDANLDRAAAYGLLGSLTAFALRRKPILAGGLVIALACGLEAAQLFIPGRDARLGDALMKASAGTVGLTLAYGSFRILRWLRRWFRLPIPAL